MPIKFRYPWNYYCAGDEIKKNELGGACSVYGGVERCVHSSGGKT
jgi:hypothetical protein